jgi:hypothetical protein
MSHRELKGLQRHATLTIPALAALVTIGCAAPPWQPTTLTCGSFRRAPVVGTTGPVTLRSAGIVVLPPRGEHWCFAEVDATGVTFTKSLLLGKRLETRPETWELLHTLVASVAIDRVDPPRIADTDRLRAYADQTIAQAMAEATKAYPHRTLDLRISLDRSLGIDCVRVDHTQEQRGNPNLPGGVLTQVTRSNYCRHPDAPEIVVVIGFSERYIKDRHRPVLDDLSDEVTAFAKGVRFGRPE